MKRILLALTFLVGFHSFALAQRLPAPSLWQNLRGSTLEVYFVNPDGTFQGQFINRASGFQCKGIPYPAAGMNIGSAVFFSVTFVQCSSQTTWYGTVNGNGMTTKWNLVYLPPSGPPQTIPGTDSFTRVR